MDGKTGFESISYGGLPIRSNCNLTVTVVQFRCNANANWSAVADNNVTKFLVSAEFSLVQPCWVCYMSGSYCNGYSVCVLLFTCPLLKYISIAVSAPAHICDVIQALCYGMLWMTNLFCKDILEILLKAFVRFGCKMQTAKEYRIWS